MSDETSLSGKTVDMIFLDEATDFTLEEMRAYLEASDPDHFRKMLLSEWFTDETNREPYQHAKGTSMHQHRNRPISQHPNNPRKRGHHFRKGQ